MFVLYSARVQQEFLKLKPLFLLEQKSKKRLVLFTALCNRFGQIPNILKELFVFNEIQFPDQSFVL